ncbi:MAG: Glycosyl transferase GT2 family [Candidatus Moranbacteria bacterium GW2011_GWC2_45_10]|nr:MAG: Glycosyl transferase GT2 family [Candidatus Moranbacteria bacterium GW2011_GWC2_45_10]
MPLFNEEGNVKELHRRIVEACGKTGKSSEVIFIDDGSKDATVRECEELSPLKLIKFRKNFGQTAAFDAGIKNAVGDVVITMDGDLQNDPNDIPLLLEKMKEGFDVVSGWRWQRKDTLSKHLSSRAANLMRKILIQDSIHDSGCSLKAYRRECFEGIDLFGEMHRFMPAILQLEGFTVGEVKVSHHARVHGKTKYNWKRGVKGMVDMVSVWFWRKYANRPLHLFGGSGVFLSLAGFAILIWMAIEKIFLGASLSERIWPLVGLFMILAGIQLFVSGLLADILAKNYYKNHGKMNYNVKEIVEG